MAKIGNFGSTIVFETSDKKVLTFSNFSRTVKSKWAEHPGIDIPPASEYISRELDTVSMNIKLSATLGVRPRSVLESIENACKNGSVNYLVIGNKKVGSGKYYIESVSETWDAVYAHGELVEATLDISFHEYGD